MYKGAEEQLLPSYFECDQLFNGNDGFADLTHDSEPDVSILKEKHAVIAIGEFLLNNPKDVSIIALGPLTTIALVFKLFPKSIENIVDIAIMGGNIKGRTRVIN